MTNKNPKCIIEFDSKEYSKEEQEYLIFRFASLLMKLEAQQQAQKAKTKKEQQGIENELMDFGSKVLKGIQNHYSVD